MFLTKLTVDPRSREFRRDCANIHDMHRTVMSGYPEIDNDIPAREAHGVLWRLDDNRGTYVQYVQSATEPNWSKLPAGHLIRPPEIRPLKPVIDAIRPGRKLAFRLMANPTKCDFSSRKRVPLRTQDEQIQWLIRKGEQHGFVIPSAQQGGADVAPSAVPRLTGSKDKAGKITVDPVRFDGHLVVTDDKAFTSALVAGIGRAKAYGCGLISLAPARIQ
ncbi:type I-E CRISPR-associated protein Cas6/Cse3/CasE [Umezawaea sp. NPDC059074]|uniref:type I-E CRISPR-associated protein Cas6/Cse3/CasE n=1 Tax=Umezawaea sp. NPDC059074 TaxID=3346716 RepID=UPI00368C9CD0